MTQRAWTALRVEPRRGLDLLGGDLDPWSCWARGALLLSLGEFAQAFDLLQPLAQSRPASEPAGLAAARVASGLRQLEEHDAAMPWDEQAVASPGRAVTDGWVGLAADAVGQADSVLAQQRLARAQQSAVDWRDEVRIGWVATEIALLTDRVVDAQQAARRSLAISQAQDAPRHRVKSGLFLGAAVRRTDPDEALAVLRAALVAATRLQLAPFVGPLVTVLGDQATAADRSLADAAERFIAARLPTGHGNRWRRRMRSSPA